MSKCKTVPYSYNINLEDPGKGMLQYLQFCLKEFGNLHHDVTL